MNCVSASMMPNEGARIAKIYPGRFFINASIKIVFLLEYLALLRVRAVQVAY